MEVFIRTPYNYDRKEASDRCSLKCEDKSLTVQSQKEEADINTIVRRFGLTGQLPNNIRTPQYGDFTGITDYQSALNSVIAAEESFMLLPAEIRKKFGHNPQEFYEFCIDPKNRDELVKMGLASKKEPADKGAQATDSGGKPVAEKTQEKVEK